MNEIAELIKNMLAELNITANVTTDQAKEGPISILEGGFSDSITVKGTFDTKETWQNGIYLNSRHFLFHISGPHKNFKPGDKISIELIVKSHKLPKFRKYGNTDPNKIVAKLKEWLASVNP